MKHLVSLSAIRGTFYRGIAGPYNPEYLKSKKITWVTQDKDYARRYADTKGNVHSFNVKIVNSFNFRFRTLEVHVKFDDMLSRIHTNLMDLFRKNKLGRKTAMGIDDVISDLEDEFASNKKMLKVWEWWEEAPQLIDILISMGYDSIEALEGDNDDVPTYGLFKSSMLTKV